MAIQRAVSSLKFKYIVLTLLVALAIITAAVLQIWIDFQETKRRQELTAADVTKVVEAHVFNTVTQAQNILGLVAETIIDDDGPHMMREAGRWKQLHAFCASLIGCKSIAVVDPSGQIVALSDTRDVPNIDASDRLYFKVPQKTKRLFIGPAVVSRVKGSPILFSIALPVFDSAGKLLSVVSAGMVTSHATDFYGLMGFGVSTTVSIFKGNGDLVARYPDMASHVGKNNAKGQLFAKELPKAPSGTYESISVFDGKTRIAAYQSVKDLDLVIFAGIEKNVAYQNWWNRSAWTASIIGFLLVFILFILYFGYRSLSRQGKLEVKNRELSELATIDGLTGIANRRFFDLTLQREWDRHKRDKSALSVLMLDVDFFKSYNDRYGHQAGDECLRKIAQILDASIHRDIDLIARYGGEEFAAILNCDANGAYVVAERMRLAVGSLAIPHEDSKIGTTVSISIGLASTSTSKIVSKEDLIQLADVALYESKSNGRNMVSPSPGKIEALEVLG
ncbi:sensor domain-containing diguanylate cyclase [Janthinobacterium sp. 17J80-10]|uniref:sensor domain-containing diguanylate cyclase n=1 Tax=Janthinobacterium sp. 17J80-10 TaxID=2497863 RepID=UPI0010054E7E|nr:sensor domain-containing diguanylate cyclase [Janthinobacterium sp. 17J80-10]QAU32787.1 diguanylate cyclase [Janthinobacterium sp. 17J80-10]